MKLLMRFALALAVGLPFITASTAQITVREIPPPSEGGRCYPRTINEAGEVLLTCDRTKISVWSSQTGQHTELVFPPGMAGQPMSMNDLGQVSGAAWDEQRNPVGFIWSRETGFTTVPGTYLVAHVNSAGQAAVQVFDGFTFRWYLRLADGNLIPLPPGWDAASYKPLNNLGQVGLHPMFMSSPTWSVWSSAQGLNELALPPVPPGAATWDFAYVVALNDAGHMAGVRANRALLYTPGVGFQVLSPEAQYSIAYDMNAFGHVSGFASWGLDTYSPVVWRSATDVAVLPLYEGVSAAAHALNSAGQIIGYTLNGKPVLWTIAREPVTPVEHVTSIDSSLANLVSAGSISSTDAKALTAKLEAVSKSLQTADTRAASNQLLALSNQITALEKSRRLSSEKADALRTQIANARSSIR
jgi:hypothetical protein